MDFELEEKEAKKALAVFTAAYYYQVIPEREEAQRRIEAMNEFFDVIIGTEKGKSIIYAFLNAVKTEQKIEKARGNLKKLFGLDNSEHAAEIRENLKAVGLKEENFATLALCALDKDIEKVSDYILADVDPDEEPQEELVAVQRNSIAVVGNALSDFRKGNHRTYAKLLIQGLKQSCEKFANEPDRDKAMFWADNTEDILYLIDLNPELAKECGVTDNQLKIAREVASLSNDIKVGIQAVEILASLQLNHNEAKVAPEMSQKLLSDIVNMQIASAKKPDLMKKWDEPAAGLAAK